MFPCANKQGCREYAGPCPFKNGDTIRRLGEGTVTIKRVTDKETERVTDEETERVTDEETERVTD